MAERSRIAKLHDATRKLIEADSEAEILDVAVSTVDRVLGFGANSIRKADTESNSFSVVARSESSRTLLGDHPVYELNGESPAARAYRDDETIVNGAESGSPVREPFTAAMYVPLEGYGVLSVGTRSESFSEEDVELVEILAETITAALERTRRERTLWDLHEASRRLTRAESESEICEIAVDAGSDLLGFSLTTVLLYDEPTDRLVPVAVTEAVTDLVSDLPSVEPGEGIIGRAYERGESERCDDVRESAVVLNPETAIRSELVVPLGEHGVIVFDSPQVGVIGESDQLFAQILAASVEAALDRRERDERVQEYVREIERKNDRLETFASVISHDLRNPLNIARGYLDLAREKHDIEELDTVADAHERIDSLIDDVLTLARQGRDIGALEPVPLSATVELAWSSIAAPDAELIAGSLPTIRADQSRLRQLLENLLRNAVEHGGEDVRIRVGALDSGFFVADDGPGIPESVQEQLFEQDFDVRSDRLGLGLQIVQTIVDAHGWSIEATESRDGGARFEITGVEFVD